MKLNADRLANALRSTLPLLLLCGTLRSAADDVVSQAYPERLAAFEDRDRLLERFHREGPGAAPALVAALSHERPFVRRTAAHLLARLGDPVTESLEVALDNPDFQVRRIAIDALAVRGQIADYWARILMDPHASIRRDARFDLMTRYVDDHNLDAVMDGFAVAYRDGDAAARRNLVLMLTALDPRPDAAGALLVEATRDPETEIQKIAFRVVIAPTIETMREQVRKREWALLAEQFGDTDIDAWPERELAREAFYLRAQAYHNLRDSAKAQSDLAHSIAIAPDRRMLLLKAQNTQHQLEDPVKALELYIRAVETDVGFGGHLLYSSILGAVGLLRAEGRYDEALGMLERANPDALRGDWGAIMREAQGLTLLEQGRADAARERFREALGLEGVSDRIRSRIEALIETR